MKFSSDKKYFEFVIKYNLLIKEKEELKKNLSAYKFDNKIIINEILNKNYNNDIDIKKKF